MDRVLDAVPLWAGVVAVLGAFFAAVRLLGAATQALGPDLSRLLQLVLVGDAPALGIGWLAAYVLGNGSLVAAVAVSLFSAGLVAPAQLYLLVAGSRLGAAGVVLFIGALDYVQERRLTLSDSLTLGLLTSVVTVTVVLPATAVGYLLVLRVLPRAGGERLAVDPALSPGVGSPTTALASALGPAATFVVAVVLLVASLDLFDRLLGRLDTERLQTRYLGRLEHRWVSFGLGVLVTGVTTSVAFSLGALVPLYNRGYVERSHVVPYILGANVGTFVDTLVVAALLGEPTGVALVALFVVLTAVAAVLSVVIFDPYHRSVEWAVDRILGDPVSFWLTLLALVALPLGLVAVR